MITSMAGRPFGRVAIGAFILLWCFFAFAFLGGQREWYQDSVDKFNQQLKTWVPENSWTSGFNSPEDPTDTPDEFALSANASIGGLEESLTEKEKPESDLPEEKPASIVTEEKPTSSVQEEKHTSTIQEKKPTSTLPISYQLDVPAKVGCEDLVNSLQLRLISEYRKLLKGIRYANIWGYLETENKGDAAIWAAQQILFSMMGIKFENACRFMSRGCDLQRFNATLRKHSPFSAIVMAGGGNFNDHYWEDQPSRMEMIENYHDIPVRSFPQSIHMRSDKRTQETKKSFGGHPNLQLAARDQRSFDWLNINLNEQSMGGKQVPKNVLVPDIAFMWGNRPDFRTDTEKTHDILILARDDAEISAGEGAHYIPFGSGLIDIGGKIGNVTYNKVDWKFTHTPGIDKELPQYLVGKVQGAQHDDSQESEQQQEHTEQHTEQQDNSDQSSDGNPPATDENRRPDDQVNQEAPKEEQKQEESHTDEDRKEGDSKDSENNGEKKEDGGSTSTEHSNKRRSTKRSPNLSARGFEAPTVPEFVQEAEIGRNQRAWAKANAGFELLGSARFVITDRLHGHIMSTIIGVPHVLMDSKLGKNLDFHDTWTKECECTKVTTDFEQSVEVARLYFESLQEGQEQGSGSTA